MWKRVLWDILCLILVFCAPWWVTLVVGIAGVALFDWYLEIVFLGMLYDVFFGGITTSWYGHIIHTIIFTTPLLVGQFIKTKINV